MLLDQVKDTIKKNNLISGGDRIVVGVSGGPDSVALLYLLNSLKKEFNLSLHVASLDHMLRKDSARDAEFVKRLAGKLGIPFTLGRVNLKKISKKGSQEERARDARLAFLFAVAKKAKAKKIALGHNRDDQAETVLMRILRGTGLYGLVGISPKRNISGYQIVRPLIEVTRKEIEAFLRKKKINPCIDKSNLSDIYLRNKIRHKLIPYLEKEYNRNIGEVLANLAESASYDYDYLLEKTQPIREKMRKKLKIKKILRLHPAIRRLLLRYAIGSVKGNLRRITLRHIKEIEDLLLSRPLNSIVDLPQGVSVIKKKKTLLFYSR